jgi:hypothetical protein
VSGLTDATEHKLRFRPKEAAHSIEDLPSLSEKAIESDKVSAAEILKSLGLEVSGVGKSAELWFVGAREQIEDGEVENDTSVEAMGSLSSGPSSGEAMQ